jgi:hypothetical protein
VDTATIESEVRSTAVSVALSGSDKATAFAIGISYASNLIGWSSLYSEDPLEVLAFAQGSDISADNGITLSSIADSTIDATISATSVAIAASKKNAFSLSVGGLTTLNKISSHVQAYIDGDTTTSDIVTQGGDVSLSATDTSQIKADAQAVSVAAALGGKLGGALAIGLSIADNTIDNEVAAYIKDANVLTSGGDVTLRATDLDPIDGRTTSITAKSIAVAVSAGIGKQTGLALSGGAAESTNIILSTTNAYLQDSNLGTASNLVGNVDIDASSTAAIDATIGAVAAAVAFGGKTGVGVALGVAVARNFIGADIDTAMVHDYETVSGLSAGDSLEQHDTVQITEGAREGDVYRYVGTQTLTQAPVADYSSNQNGVLVGTNQHVLLDDNHYAFDYHTGQKDLSNPEDPEFPGVEVPTLLVTGDRVALTGNFGGGRSGEVYQYIGTADINISAFEALEKGQNYSNTSLWRLVPGGTVGATYRFLGAADTLDLAFEDYANAERWELASIDLRTQDYSDRRLWEQVNLSKTASQIQAYSQNSSIHSGGDLSADAVSDQTIDALVFAGAAAIAGGGKVGVGVSGAGVYTENNIQAFVKAYIDGDGSTGVSADSVSLNATDDSTITASAIAASLAAGLGGTAGIAVSIGISLATNEINNDVAAYIANADQGVDTTVGGITINASEDAGIEALSLAASAAIGLGGTAGIAISGAGAWARNVILTDTNASIRNSEVDSASIVDIDATNTASVEAVILAASLAVAGGGTAGVGASIGISIAENTIGRPGDASEVQAYIEDSTVNARAGALTLDASGTQFIEAVVVAASAAVALGGTAGIGFSGAGVSATNLIVEHVKAYIDGDDNNDDDAVTGIHADSISLVANDTSIISAVAAAASLAASVAGTAAVSLSIGVSLSRNEIRNEVEAGVRNADDVLARTGDIVIAAGAVGDTTDVPIDYSASGNAALKKGDLVSSGGKVYRFLGEGEKIRQTYDSSAGEVYLKTDDTVRIADGDENSEGGDVGALYRYTGVDLSPPEGEEDDEAIDLREVDYSTGSWVLVEEYSVYDTSAGDVAIEEGDIVEIVNGYTVISGSDETGIDLVQNASYVRISDAYESDDNKSAMNGATYRFIGTSQNGVDLDAEDYSDESRWELGGPAKDQFGVGGTFYRYIVSNNDADDDGDIDDIDLSLQDYTDTSKWQQVTRNLGNGTQQYATNDTYWSEMSSITALSIAASVGAAIGGTAGIGLSGAGADATNVILTDTNAYIEDSGLEATLGNVDVDAANSSSIDALIISASLALGVGGTAGVGASIGVSLARNYVGWNTDASLLPEPDFATGDASRNHFTQANPLRTNDLVRIDAGARAGDMYRYIGDTIQADFNSNIGTRTLGAFDAGDDDDETFLQQVVLISDGFSYDGDDDGSNPDAKIGGLYMYVGDGGSVNLNAQDYTDTDNWMYVGSTMLAEQDYGNTDFWEQVNLVESPSDTQAYGLRSSITAGGALTLNAIGTESINAFVFAGSAAISGGGVAGVGAAGAGVASVNRIATNVQAFLDGDGADGIDAASVALKAEDTSSIQAFTGAASLAASFAGVAAVSVSIGVALADNIITNTVSSYIDNADDGVVAREGEIRVEAVENSSVEAVAIAASLSIAVGTVGIAIAGAGVKADNVIANQVSSYISNSTVVTASAFDHQSNQQLGSLETGVLETGDRVLVVEGATGAFGSGTAGQVYEYIGVTRGSPTNPVGLRSENYQDASQWQLVAVGSKDIVVDAQNTASITSLVGAIAAAVSGGFVAAAGAVGVSLSHNIIGEYHKRVFDVATLSFTTASYQNQALAYISDSTVMSAGDLSVTASSTETIESTAFAGSVAIAIGIGGAIAGAGVQVTNRFSTDTHAYIDDSNVIVAGDIGVTANSDSKLEKSLAIGVALAGGLGAVTVAVSLVDTVIQNDVQAYINGSAGEMIAAGGDISVEAVVDESRIEDVVAVTASVAVGAIAAAGGGLSMNSTVNNTVNAYISGPIDVMALGDVTVSADETAFIEGDAVNVTVAFGLGMAIGISLVKNEMDSQIAAQISGTSIRAANVSVLGSSIANIPTTNTAGVSASFGVSLTGNRADANIRNTVAADIVNSDVIAANAVTISAFANNTANAYAFGGAFGAIAAGAMISDVKIGRSATVDEVTAGVGDNSNITAGSLTVTM